MRAFLVFASKAFALVGGVLLLLIVLVTTTNVAAFGFDKVARLWGATVSGLPGFEDFVRLAISAAALLFFPYCQMRRGHVAVDVFVASAPRRVRQALDRIWLAVTVFAAVFLAYWMWFGMLESRADGAESRVLEWPEWPFYAPGLAALALWALVALMQMLFGDEYFAERADG